jgi:predicted PurR-regulated permease PerM
VIRQPFKARTPDELIALLSAVATAILAAIIVMVLYFGREIIIPIALAILLSFVLAPLVGLLQRVRIPRGLAVVSVVIIAFALIFAMAVYSPPSWRNWPGIYRDTNPRSARRSNHFVRPPPVGVRLNARPAC